MINIIANIVGVAIVVGAIATVLDKRINALQGELHRHKRQTETEFRSVENELSYINSLQQDGNGMADEAERIAYSARVNVEEAIEKIEEINREFAELKNTGNLALAKTDKNSVMIRKANETIGALERRTEHAISKSESVIIDKIEEINRDLRGETYAIEFWGGDCYGGFKKNGDPIDVSHSEAVIMTRQEAERIKKMLGTGAIVNRSKTILKNLEDK